MADIPREQEVCPDCGAKCTWEVCDCPLTCFKQQLAQEGKA